MKQYTKLKAIQKELNKKGIQTDIIKSSNYAGWTNKLYIKDSLIPISIRGLK